MRSLQRTSQDVGFVGEDLLKNSKYLSYLNFWIDMTKKATGRIVIEKDLSAELASIISKNYKLLKKLAEH